MVSAGLVAVIVLVPALLLGVIGLFIWNYSYKYQIHIARQAGTDPKDVIMHEDKFKVVQRGGKLYIKLKRMRLSMPNIDYSKWAKFSSRAIEVGVADSEGRVKYNEGWNNLRDRLNRGLYVYMSDDGQFFPMVITAPGEFTVLDQDTRNFIVDELVDVNNVALTGKQKAAMVIGIGFAVIVLAGLFVLFLVYLTNNVELICGAGDQGMDFVSEWATSQRDAQPEVGG